MCNTSWSLTYQHIPVLLQEVLEGLRCDHQGIFLDCNPRTLAEVVWSSFLGIMQVERSKREITGKNHIDETCNLALTILERGIVRKNNIPQMDINKKIPRHLAH